MGSCAAPSAKGDDKFITTDYLQQCQLSYYVNDGILKPIGKEYIFQELVNPIHNRKDNQVTVSLTVEYIDQQTKATQVSQFDLVLEKNGSNWKIVK
ncbi:conjugal transfer protein [Klebsiella pneumoniae]|nr:conjugal transfer protein [Klebsiella pneumoniae]